MTEIDTSTARPLPEILAELQQAVDEVCTEHLRYGHIADMIRINALRHGATSAQVENFVYGKSDFVGWMIEVVGGHKLTAERDAAVSRAEQAEARVAELETEIERLLVALGAEQDSADEMANVLSAFGDGLMFDVDRLQAALDHHDALREAAIRAIPMPTDAAATLERLTAQAWAQGMREAAEIAAHRYAVCEDAFSKGFGAEERHCALEAKHIEDKIIARAEEIENEARNG